MVGVAKEEELLEKLNDKDSGVRYWAVIGLMQLDNLNKSAKGALTNLLDDSSPSVQIAAAETLCYNVFPARQLKLLAGGCLTTDRGWRCRRPAAFC